MAQGSHDQRLPSSLTDRHLTVCRRARILLLLLLNRRLILALCDTSAWPILYPIPNQRWVLAELSLTDVGRAATRGERDQGDQGNESLHFSHLPSRPDDPTSSGLSGSQYGHRSGSPSHQNSWPSMQRTSVQGNSVIVVAVPPLPSLLLLLRLTLRLSLSLGLPGRATFSAFCVDAVVL